MSEGTKPVFTGGFSRDTKAILSFQSEKKSMGLAYIIWFFAGLAGVHRFYLERTISGVVMLTIFAIAVIIAGFVGALVGSEFGELAYFAFIISGLWWLIDLFLVPGISRQFNFQLIQRINDQTGLLDI